MRATTKAYEIIISNFVDFLSKQEEDEVIQVSGNLFSTLESLFNGNEIIIEDPNGEQIVILTKGARHEGRHRTA